MGESRPGRFPTLDHSKAEEKGFVWNLYMSGNYGPELCTEEDHAARSISTQLAAGHIGKLENWLIQEGGVQRVRVRGYVGETQWRANWCETEDLYLYFAKCLAEAEGASRSGLITLEDMRNCAVWDYTGCVEHADVHEYDSASDATPKAPRGCVPGATESYGADTAPRTHSHTKNAARTEKTPVGNTTTKTVDVSVASTTLPSRRKDSLPFVHLKNGPRRNTVRGGKPQRWKKTRFRHGGFRNLSLNKGRSLREVLVHPPLRSSIPATQRTPGSVTRGEDSFVAEPFTAICGRKDVFAEGETGRDIIGVHGMRPHFDEYRETPK